MFKLLSAFNSPWKFWVNTGIIIEFIITAPDSELDFFLLVVLLEIKIPGYLSVIFADNFNLTLPD